MAFHLLERQRDGGKHDDRLPAPERECGQLVEREPHVAGTLHDVVGGGEQGRENSLTGMMPDLGRLIS